MTTAEQPPTYEIVSVLFLDIVGYSLRSIEEQIELLTQISQNKYVSPYEIGLIHEALGDRDEAFRQWELAFEQRSPWLVYLAREPRLMHLRGQPRFDALVARIHRLINRDTKRL